MRTRSTGLSAAAALRSLSIIIAATVIAGAAQPVDAQCENKLLASDGAAGDHFAYSVSISGDVALIGAYNNSANGSAYLFRHDGIDWVEEVKLLASDGAAYDRFGHSVSISGDVAVIGARLDDDNGDMSGSAYVFRFDGANWIEEAKLLASDGAPEDEFGNSVSVSGDVAVIGAHLDDDNGAESGSAYVFRFDGANWIEEAKLLASDGAVGDYFGYSVSTSGDVAVIGAYNDTPFGDDSGSAFIFHYDGTSWIEEAKLLASDGAVGDYFGYSVSTSGDIAVIGAYRDDDNGSSSGSAYVFRYDGLNWIEEAKLLASDGARDDYFGISVSVSGDLAVVGAMYGSGNDIYSGSAYVFRYGGANWIEETELLPSDGMRQYLFGYSVSVSGDLAVIGAYRDDDNGTESGSAYVFNLTGPTLGASATCPGGGPVTIRWSCATPGGRIALIFASNTGGFIVPGRYPCSGTQLGLGTNAIQIVYKGGAGADGSRTINSITGPAACGGYLQLLDLTTCATSNVVQIR